MKVNISKERKKSVYEQTLEVNQIDLTHSLAMVGIDPDIFDTETDLSNIEAILETNDPSINNTRFHYERILHTSKTINLMNSKLEELNNE
jgi:hypothetical protein